MKLILIIIYQVQLKKKGTKISQKVKPKSDIIKKKKKRKSKVSMYKINDFNPNLNQLI